MKRLIIAALAAAVISLPISALAWPRVLHDDGGPYKDFALAKSNQYLTAAVLTPWSVELTILTNADERLAWASFELPTDFSLSPDQQISVQMQAERRNRYLIYIPVIALENDFVSRAGYFTARLEIENNHASLTPQAGLNRLTAPANAKDMDAFISEREIYYIWKTQDQDGISTVLVSQAIRAPSDANNWQQ